MKSQIPQSQALQKILVLQTAFLGDVLLTIPFLKTLKIRFPHSEIHFLARKGVGQILLQLGLIERLFEIEKGKASSYKKVKSQLDEKYDYLWCIHQSLRTKLFVSRLRSRQKIGFKGFLSWFIFDHSVLWKKQWPEPLRVLSLLEPIDPQLISQVEKKLELEDVYKLDGQKKFQFSIQDFGMGLRQKIKNLYEKTENQNRTKLLFGSNASDKQKILIFPGSVWETKRWTEEGYTQLVQSLEQAGFQIVLMGSKNEFELCEKVKASSSAINLAGETSLLETLFCMIDARLVIGNDSASSHLAAVAEVKSITLFGPTILEFGYRPWSDLAHILQEENLACRPCGPHGHRQCPLGTHVCMKNITAEEVFQFTKTVLHDLN